MEDENAADERRDFGAPPSKIRKRRKGKRTHSGAKVKDSIADVTNPDMADVPKSNKSLMHLETTDESDGPAAATGTTAMEGAGMIVLALKSSSSGTKVHVMEDAVATSGKRGERQPVEMVDKLRPLSPCLETSNQPPASKLKKASRAKRDSAVLLDTEKKDDETMMKYSQPGSTKLKRPSLSKSPRAKKAKKSTASLSDTAKKADNGVTMNSLGTECSHLPNLNQPTAFIFSSGDDPKEASPGLPDTVGTDDGIPMETSRVESLHSENLIHRTALISSKANKIKVATPYLPSNTEVDNETLTNSPMVISPHSEDFIQSAARNSGSANEGEEALLELCNAIEAASKIPVVNTSVQNSLLAHSIQPITPIAFSVNNAKETTHGVPNTVENGIVNNLSAESHCLANSIPPSGLISSGINHENGVIGLLTNDDHIVMGSAAVESHDLANSIQNSAFNSFCDKNAKEAALGFPNGKEFDKGAAVDSTKLVNPHLANSIHPLGSSSPTGESATNSPRKEIDSPKSLFSFTLSEVANLFDIGSSLQDEAEYPALVTVEGYRVRREFAATAQNILRKHGDILARTSFEGLLLPQLLENACAIYQKLEKSEFLKLTLPELESMYRDVCDLGKTNMEVSWLAKRLNDICSAKKVLQQSALIKNQRNQNQQSIVELEKEVEIQKELMQQIQHKIQGLEEKLESEKAKSETIQEMIMDFKGQVQQFYKKSMVDGI